MSYFLSTPITRESPPNPEAWGRVLNWKRWNLLCPLPLLFLCFSCTPFFGFPPGNTWFSPLHRWYSLPVSWLGTCATFKHPVLAANCSPVSLQSETKKLRGRLPKYPAEYANGAAGWPPTASPPPFCAADSRLLPQIVGKRAGSLKCQNLRSLRWNLGTETLQPSSRGGALRVCTWVRMCVHAHMHACMRVSPVSLPGPGSKPDSLWRCTTYGESICFPDWLKASALLKLLMNWTIIINLTMTPTPLQRVGATVTILQMRKLGLRLPADLPRLVLCAWLFPPPGILPNLFSSWNSYPSLPLQPSSDVTSSRDPSLTTLYSSSPTTPGVSLSNYSYFLLKIQHNLYLLFIHLST